MSTPRDHDPDDGNEWREPSHLGGEGSDEPNFADRRRSPRDESPNADRDAWQPPGWDLPASRPPQPPAESGPVPEAPSSGGSGWFGLGRRRQPRGEADRVFTYQGDLVGAQAWALQQGWTMSDGSAPEDAVLADLIAAAPVRATRDHRPGSVLRGRGGNLELVAFDVVYVSGRYVVPEYAVTAAPMLGPVPGFRLSPARFWKHGTAGLVPIPSGNDAFDTRWQLFAVEDGDQVRRLVADPAVQGLLLGSDDGDEFWSAAGHVAAIRPDGHRPLLIEHHARLLTAIVGALVAGY